MKKRSLCFSLMFAGSEINVTDMRMKHKTLSVIDDDGLLVTREIIQTYVELDGTEIPFKIEVFQRPYAFLGERIEYQKQDVTMFRKYIVRDYVKSNGKICSTRKYLKLVKISSSPEDPLTHYRRGSIICS